MFLILSVQIMIYYSSQVLRELVEQQMLYLKILQQPTANGQQNKIQNIQEDFKETSKAVDAPCAEHKEHARIRHDKDRSHSSERKKRRSRSRSRSPRYREREQNKERRHSYSDKRREKHSRSRDDRDHSKSRGDRDQRRSDSRDRRKMRNSDIGEVSNVTYYKD